MIVSPLPQGMLRPDGTVDVAALQVLLNDLRNAAVTLYASGTTAQRPRDPFPYQLYYDTTTGQYLYCSAVRNGATPAVWTPLGGGGGGSGTVTSVDQSVPVEFSVSGNPVTTAGTLAIAKVNQSANRVWAGPTSGAAAQPTFRALVAADFPFGFASSWLWGSGLDGSVHFDGTATFPFATKTGSVYVLGRNIHATDCIIDAGVTVQHFDYANPGVGGGMQLYCTGTFTCNGHWSGDGQTNIFNTNIADGTGSPSGVNGIYLWAADGGDGNGGANGSAGGAIADAFGGNGGAGGASISPRAGGAGGIATVPASGTNAGGYYELYTAYTFQSGLIRFITSPFWKQFAGGAGGGAGGGVTTGSHKGGAGGSGGHPTGIFAKSIAGSGVISSDGSPGNIPPTSTDAGGGGGGGGGVVCVITTTPVIPCTVRALGGAGRASGGAGATGSPGVNGKVIVITVV